MLRRLICWLLRSHQWRRLRRAEYSTMASEGNPVAAYRICGRCYLTKTVKTRKAK